MELTPTSFYTIRFGDCDFLGHLNNARYLDYFMNAREDHLKNAYNVQLADYYKTGLAWVVGNHEIHYMRPANYNEQVCIQTSLLKATDDYLLVEMLMMNEQQSHLKSILWSRFVPINIKTGKRESHPASFMDFAKSVENSSLTKAGNIQERLAEIVSKFKLKQVKICSNTTLFLFKNSLQVSQPNGKIIPYHFIHIHKYQHKVHGIFHFAVKAPFHNCLIIARSNGFDISV